MRDLKSNPFVCFFLLKYIEFTRQNKRNKKYVLKN